MPGEQLDFTILPMTFQLEKIFQSELDATKKYFNTKNDIDGKKLLLTSAIFNQTADSLIKLTTQADIISSVQNTVKLHDEYVIFIRNQISQIEANKNHDAMIQFKKKTILINSIRQNIKLIIDASLPSLAISLNRFMQKKGDSEVIGAYILVLALVVGSVFALLLARTFVKPIQALKAGTEKVVVGQYESIPVSTSDEIGDLTKAFNLMSDKLHQLDEMRMQMMSEISHEMRTPLQVIKAGCYSIIHTKDGPLLTQRQRDAVGMIHQASNRINNFVNSFLDIAKMEAGLMKFNFEELDLIELLNPLVAESQLIAQTRQIDLKFTFENIPPIKIDKERMSQAVSNLLSNALKYTPDAGQINIDISLVSDNIERVKIEVTDSGVGIPEADIDKLFIKFYQAKNVPLVNEKGSGLGLALVKHVSEAHGGKVSVRSKIDHGSTFTILIPCKR